MARNQQRGSKRKGTAGGEAGQGGQRKKQWRSTDANWTGHGIFMTCPRGKERKAANEFIEILTDTAASLYPHIDLSQLPLPPKLVKQAEQTVESEDEDDLRNGPAPVSVAAQREVDEATTTTGSTSAAEGHVSVDISTSALQRRNDTRDEDQDEVATDVLTLSAPAAKESDIEAELRAELATLREADSKTFGKQRLPPPSSQGLGGEEKLPTAPAFRLLETGTECLVFIGVHHQLDPIELCDTFLAEVERTGEARSRIISRLSPVAGLCIANQQELDLFARRVLPKYLPDNQKGTFKIDPRIRSHNTLNRTQVIEIVASSIPRGSDGNGWRADLKKADKWVVVEVHKAQAGIGILSNYTRFCKMNPLELANSVKTKRLEEQQKGKLDEFDEESPSSAGVGLGDGADVNETGL